MRALHIKIETNSEDTVSTSLMYNISSFEFSTPSLFSIKKEREKERERERERERDSSISKVKIIISVFLSLSKVNDSIIYKVSSFILRMVIFTIDSILIANKFDLIFLKLLK